MPRDPRRGLAPGPPHADTQILGCSSPLRKTAQYLRVPCVCTEATAGRAYTSLRLCGCSIVLGTRHIQVSAFGSFSDCFFSKYFQSADVKPVDMEGGLYPYLLIQTE